MLVYQFQGKSALWGGGAGTVRGARGKLTGQGPVFHLACLVLLIHARALHQDLCHTSQCPRGSDCSGFTALSPGPQLWPKNPSFHLTFFFAKMSPAK